MKPILVLLLLLAGSVAAQAPVTLTVDPRAAATPVPAGFPSLSFETSNLLPQRNGDHLFDPANRGLAALFLAAPNHDAAAKEGITLGCALLAGGAWDGKWTPVAPDQSGKIAIPVPGTSAAIVRIAL